MLELHKKLKQGNVSPLYLLYGTESFLIDETKHKIINAVLTEEEQDFNLSVADMEEIPVETALEEAETLPFIGKKRVVLITNPIFLTAQKDKSKMDHNLKALERYLQNPSPDTVLMIIAPYEKLDERKKIVKLLKKNGDVLEASKADQRFTESWLDTRAAEHGVSISPQAKELLLQTAGTDLMLLSSELDKMAIYIGKGGEITAETVETLAARTLEQNIFALIDGVIGKNAEKAMRIYYDLLRQKEEPLKILSVLAGQFRLYLHVKDLLKAGYGQKQIAGTLKVHPYRVKLAAQQAGKFSNDELRRLIDELAEADFGIKSGKMDKTLALELFMIKAAGPSPVK